MKEIQYGNAIIKIHRPVLTEEEQARQERQLEIALQLFGKEMMKSEREKK